MKLMIIIVRNEDDEGVIRELVQKDFRVTRMASTGGFLRRGNSTLLVGVEDEPNRSGDRHSAPDLLLSRGRPAPGDGFRGQHARVHQSIRFYQYHACIKLQI